LTRANCRASSCGVAGLAGYPLQKKLEKPMAGASGQGVAGSQLQCSRIARDTATPQFTDGRLKFRKFPFLYGYFRSAAGLPPCSYCAQPAYRTATQIAPSSPATTSMSPSPSPERGQSIVGRGVTKLISPSTT